MRLLDVTTFRLKEFSNPKEVKYAILSHRWGKDEDEVHFDDIEKVDLTEVKLKKGWDKVAKSCEQARIWGMEWIWIDTCCINKSSSSELTEAINSMFMWYRESDVCIAYLNDVPGGASHDLRAKNSRFRASAWFKRGWTLQELIAPGNVVFYGDGESGWVQLGNKASLAATIMDITHIDEDVLLHCNFENVSVAKKMSWAANRSTTRVEDRAYSLAGLFGVTITPIYGEKEKAFQRLQIEITKVTSDHSLFAWTFVPSKEGEPPISYTGSMLAPAPDCFRDSSDIIAVSFKEYKEKYCFSGSVHDHAMTNEGLRIKLPFVMETAFDSVIESVARPYRYAKELSTMKRTMKLVKDNVGIVNSVTSFAKRDGIRAFLSCKFASGEEPWVSIILKSQSSGRYYREPTLGGINDLHSPDMSLLSFYTVQVEELYIRESLTPLPDIVNQNLVPNADYVELPGAKPDEGAAHDEKPQTPEELAAATKELSLDAAAPPPYAEPAKSPKDADMPTVSGMTVDPDSGTVHLELKIPESGRKLLNGWKAKGFGKK